MQQPRDDIDNAGGAATPLSISQQKQERDSHAQRYIATLIGLLKTGDLDGAERALRRIAFSELMVNAAALHDALRSLPMTTPIGALASTERPALLLALAFARRESTGRLDAMVPLLVSAAAVLRKSSASSPAQRARDLSLAALCLMLAQHSTDCIDMARRGADLVRAFTITSDDDAATLVGVAAVDLALAFFLNDRVAEAASMWRWVREHTVDPRLPRLMQADWGTSVVGLVVGDRTMVSPLAAATIEMPLMDREKDIPTRDPWWLMVATARTWAAIDRGDFSGALVMSQCAVSATPTPAVTGPLALAYCAALLLNGRTSSALTFVDEQLALLPPDGMGSTGPRLAAVGMTASAIAGDSARLAHFSTMVRPYPGLHRLASAFAAMVTGDPHAAINALAEYNDDIFGPRWRALYWTLFTAVHARAGHRAMAVEGLRNLVPLIERQRLGAWLMLIPQPELDAVRGIAADSDFDFVLQLLPAHAGISVVPVVTFTTREEEILRLIGQGFTNTQIANALFISPNTVKFHVAKLLKRLGVSSREEAAELGVPRLNRAPREDTKREVGTPDY